MNKKRQKKECFVREYRNQLAEEGIEINLEEAARSPGRGRSPNSSSMRSSSRQVLVSD